MTGDHSDPPWAERVILKSPSRGMYELRQGETLTQVGFTTTDGVNHRERELDVD